MLQFFLADGELAGFEKRTAELEQAVEDATTELDGRREELSEAVRRLERWRAEARLAEERSGAATGEVERLEGEQRRLEERGQRLDADVEKLSAELSRTEDEVVRSRTRLTEEAGRLARFVDAPPKQRLKLDGLPGTLESTLVHAMRLRPDERYLTAGEFADHVAHLILGLLGSRVVLGEQTERTNAGLCVTAQIGIQHFHGKPPGSGRISPSAN